MLVSLLEFLFELLVVDVYHYINYILKIGGSVSACDVVLNLFLESLVEQCCQDAVSLLCSH